MAIGKLYIGRKVKSLRSRHKNTQAQFAERIGISTSYLNQIENNQRPVSAAVLLALAEKFQIDIAQLSTGEDDRLYSALADTLMDPIFESWQPGGQALRLITQNAPGFAHALIACHRAYRAASEQISTVNGKVRISDTAEPYPYAEVRDFFHFVDNYLDALDVTAEALAKTIGIDEKDNFGVLAERLEKAHDIKVYWSEDNNGTIRSFDPYRRVLTMNSYSAPATRNFQMAVQLAQFEAADIIDDIIANANFKSSEACDICRIGLQNYFAGALLMPYVIFMQSAAKVRHDLELLSARFCVSLEQVCHRLSTLQRPGLKGVPFFFARVDRAGNITKRHSAAKLQFARYGGACPVWNVHDAFAAPGQIIRQLAETPDGVRYLCLAVQVLKGSGGFRAEHPRYALGLGCEISNAKNFVYADGLDLSAGSAFTPIGISCRICPRGDCNNRTLPPLKHRLVIDANQRGILPYMLKEN